MGEKEREGERGENEGVLIYICEMSWIYKDNASLEKKLASDEPTHHTYSHDLILKYIHNTRSFKLNVETDVLYIQF